MHSHMTAAPQPHAYAQPPVFLSSHTPPVAVSAAPAPSPAPSPLVAAPAAPIAAPSAAAAAPPSQVQLVDSIAAAAAGATGPLLLLRHLPASVSLSALGQQLCVFGRLVIKLFLTVSHGLVAVIQYQTAEMAAAALAAMRGRVYELQCYRDGALEMERWALDDIVYAHLPLMITPLPLVTIKFIGHAQ